jgi:hypothetical protein
MAAPRLQPTYLVLTNPPDGIIPLFIKGISKFSRPIVATCIRLLTGHAFTGEYTARFRPSSFDPHHCQCREPLQTPQVACPSSVRSPMTTPMPVPLPPQQLAGMGHSSTQQLCFLMTPIQREVQIKRTELFLSPLSLTIRLESLSLL